MPRASKAAVKEEAAAELFPRSALPKDILLQPAPEPLPKPIPVREKPAVSSVFAEKLQQAWHK